MIFIDTKELTKICGGQDTQDTGLGGGIGSSILVGLATNALYDASKSAITNLIKNSGGSSPILRKRGCDY